VLGKRGPEKSVRTAHSEAAKTREGGLKASTVQKKNCQKKGRKLRSRVKKKGKKGLCRYGREGGYDPPNQKKDLCGKKGHVGAWVACQAEEKGSNSKTFVLNETPKKEREGKIERESLEKVPAEELAVTTTKSPGCHKKKEKNLVDGREEDNDLER